MMQCALVRGINPKGQLGLNPARARRSMMSGQVDGVFLWVCIYLNTVAYTYFSIE